VPVLRGGSGARCPDRRMKPLFDQNLSFKLCTMLSDLFPDSKAVWELGLDRSDDRIVWQHAKDNGFVLVSQDSDFADMAAHPLRPSAQSNMAAMRKPASSHR
jgi:hypothetical protein